MLSMKCEFYGIIPKYFVIIMRGFFLLLILFFSLCSLFFDFVVNAQQGCCSWHGGIAYCDSWSGRYVCNDGTYSPSCTCWINNDYEDDEDYYEEDYYYPPPRIYPTFTPLPTYTPIPTYTPRPTRTMKPTLYEKQEGAAYNNAGGARADSMLGFLMMLIGIAAIPAMLALKSATRVG